LDHTWRLRHRWDLILTEFQNRSEGGFLRGAAYTYLFEGLGNLKPGDDPFQKAMKRQNASLVQRLTDINPIENYTAWFFCERSESFYDLYWVNHQDTSVYPECKLPLNYFENVHFTERMGFAFDSVMAIGIGACVAISNKTNTTAMTGKEHLEGIQSVNFRGATGQVKFRNRPGTPGSRDGGSTFFGILNLLPHGPSGYVLTTGRTRMSSTSCASVTVPLAFAVRN
jgi:hypothetical protein